MSRKIQMVRCKRPDDIIVVPDGPRAESTLHALCGPATGAARCGHAHLVVVGRVDFMSRKDARPGLDRLGMQMKAEAAYKDNALARVFVDAVCERLGLSLTAEMLSDLLGHPALLMWLDRVAADIARTSAAPKLYLPPGVAGPGH